MAPECEVTAATTRCGHSWQTRHLRELWRFVTRFLDASGERTLAQPRRVASVKWLEPVEVLAERAGDVPDEANRLCQTVRASPDPMMP